MVQLKVKIMLLCIRTKTDLFNYRLLGLSLYLLLFFLLRFSGAGGGGGVSVSSFVLPVLFLAGNVSTQTSLVFSDFNPTEAMYFSLLASGWEARR